MNPKPKVPSIDGALRGTVAYAVQSREGLKAALRDARAARLHAPPVGEHARRLLFGFTLPVTLMRLGWADAEIRRSVVRRLVPPLACVALFAAIGIWSLGKDLVASRHDPSALAASAQADDDDDSSARIATRARRKAERAAAAARRKETRGPAVVAGDGKHEARPPGAEPSEATDDERLVSSGESLAAASEAIKGVGASLAAAGKDVDEASSAIDSAADAVEDARAEDDHAVAKKVAAPVHRSALQTIAAVVKSRLAQLIASLSVLEWILIWIGREHHDQIAYDLARFTGAPAEALPGPPRLRLDLGWVKMKGWRALRFLIFVALGSPAAWVVGFVPAVGPALAVVVEVGWLAYWASVFGIGNSFLVWERPLQPGEAPWFIRALRACGGVPFLGFFCRLYERVLTKATRNVWPACMAFEIAPWESAGLAGLRALFSVPVLYIVTRPAFGPAATHVWVARTATSPGASPAGPGDSAPPLLAG